MKHGTGILVVDDTVDTLKALVATLAADGHQVRPVTSGAQALETIALQLPELVLLDVRMPGMDGIEVCLRIKSDPALASIPVLFLSSSEEGGERLRGFEAGGVDFIPKPFRREELLARVRAHLDLARLRARLEDLVEERTESLRGAKALLERELADRKAAETERAKLQAQLQKSQKLECIGNLAGGVAHDFNNMLTIILGHAQIGLARLDGDDPVRNDLEEIFNAGNRSASLTRQLLAFARSQPTAPVVVDVNRVVAQMLSMLRHLIGENIQLDWQPSAAPLAVRIDPSQLDQILANLCVNARDAIAGRGEIAIRAQEARLDASDCLAHPGAKPGDYVALCVADSGCGMSPEVVDQIFEPFFTTKEAGKGTGLGLSTVYGIVRQNEGAIVVESVPGRGTVFRILLPRSSATATEEGVRMGVPRRGKDRTVLLVEDSPPVRGVAKAALEGLGYVVEAVQRPSEALELVLDRSRSFDLLLTDVVMPQMDGRDLVERVRRIRPEIRWLLMSGYSENGPLRDGDGEGEGHFLQKPFTPEALAFKASELLEG